VGSLRPDARVCSFSPNDRRTRRLARKGDPSPDNKSNYVGRQGNEELSVRGRRVRDRIQRVAAIWNRGSPLGFFTLRSYFKRLRDRANVTSLSAIAWQPEVPTETAMSRCTAARLHVDDRCLP